MSRRNRGRVGGAAKAKREDAFELSHHPFSGIDPDVLKKALVGVGQDAVAEYPKLIEALFGYLRSWSPFHLLSTMASWGLVAGVSEQGAASKAIMSNVEQHHVELLQALAMMLPAGEWGSEFAKPAEVSEVISAVGKLTDAFLHRRYLEIEQEHDAEERFVHMLQERMRGHTQAVRNWGYFSDVVRISAELYGALDDDFSAYQGFSATDLIETIRDLIAIIERRHSDRFQRLRKVFTRGRTIPQFVRLYYKHFPDLDGSPDELLSSLPPATTLDQVKMMTLSHADLSLHDSLFAPIDELATMSGRDPVTVAKVLDTLSMDVGSLAGAEVDHLFMANPVWNAPIVRVGSGYFIPIPQVIFSHIHSIMRSLFEAAGLKVKLEERRAAYLEWKLEEIVRSALPKARLIPSAKWSVGGVAYETDLIATVDRVVILFEAKSAALTPIGLRGAPGRVRRHVQDLIVAPSEQSLRLADIIRRAKDGDVDALGITHSLELDVAHVDTVTRVSVTLDDFSMLSSMERELKKAGWVPKDCPLALTLNIADLGCVADILSDPLIFMHYLNERSRIQKATGILGDELDYLGLYLETGLNLGGLEKGQYRVAISGMSKPIDHYYQSRDAGVRVPKPQPKIHPYFAKVLAEIQRREFASWTTAGLDILRCASPDEQRRAVNGMERLRGQVQRNFRDPKHDCCMIIIPPEGRDGLVMFYVYPQALAANRHDTVAHLAQEALDQHARSRCTVIGRTIENWDRPYSFVIIATPPKDEVAA